MFDDSSDYYAAENGGCEIHCYFPGLESDQICFASPKKFQAWAIPRYDSGRVIRGRILAGTSTILLLVKRRVDSTRKAGPFSFVSNRDGMTDLLKALNPDCGSVSFEFNILSTSHDTNPIANLRARGGFAYRVH